MHPAHFLKILDPEIIGKNLHALRLKARESWWKLARPSMPDPVFVIGCSRSGTTVTFETLAAAPQFLSIGYEIPQFWNSLWGPHHNGWDSEVAGTQDAQPAHRDAALAYFYARLGAGQVLDKTCINVMRVPYLHALFPNARFVFIQRDGRDNISSMMDGWRKDRHFTLKQFLGALPAKVGIENGEFDDWAFFLPPGWRDLNTEPLAEVCAYQWMTANRMALEAKETIPPEQWVHMRYEDIFDHPVEMFRDAFSRLGIPFDAAMEERCATLNRRPTSIVAGPPEKEKWRKSRNAADIERIMPMIHPIMAKLGYLTPDSGG